MKYSDIPKNYSNYTAKSIALIGHMGSGKTLIGKMIAKKFKIPHFDSDKLIANKTNKTINQIFENNGEIEFRKIEEKTILEINDDNNDTKFVLSLGGGSILGKRIRSLLKKNFITLFLDVNMSVLSQRLKKNKKRPLLAKVNIEDKIKELDIIRRKYYLLADIQIENCGDATNTFALFLEKYNELNEKNYKN